jgi:hypothetical protein
MIAMRSGGDNVRLGLSASAAPASFAIGIAPPLQGAGHLLARPPGVPFRQKVTHPLHLPSPMCRCTPQGISEIAYLLLTSWNYFWGIFF